MRSLLISAALLAASALPPLENSINSAPKLRRERPKVKRMAGGTNQEIEAWNRAVEVKKQAKKVAK